MHTLSFNHSSYMFNDTFERSSLLVSSPLSIVNVNNTQSCHEQDVGEVGRRQSYSPYSRVERLLPDSLSTKCSYSCCCCYAANILMCNRLGVINHRVLCKGFSQPTLIKWPICKRFDFNGGIRESCGGMIYGVSAFRNVEKVCAFKDRRKKGKKGFGYNRKRQFLSNVSDDCVDNVEIMLSLLNGEMGFDCSDVRDRENMQKGKKNVNSGIVKRGLKCDEGVKIRSLAKSENLDLRKEGSSSELEGAKDFEVNCEGYVGETSSNECKNDWERRHNEGCVDEVVGNIEKQEIVQEEKEFLEKDNVKGSYGVSVGESRDWRKKSEKKLNEEFKQQDLTISVNIDPCNSNVVDDISDVMGLKMKYKRLEKDKSVIESTFIREKKLKSISEVSKPQEIDMKGTSSFPESRMKNVKEKTTEVSNQIEDSREEKHQKLGSREKSQQIFGISDAHFDYCERILTSHRNLDIQMKKQKRYPGSLSSEAMFTNAEGGAAKVNTTSIEHDDLSSDIKLLKEGGNEGSGSAHLKGGGSRHSSQGSGPKGPSDEMWHVNDASTQDPSESDAPDNISYISENGEPVKTSGRSLWTVIGDVVRLHWKSPRSGSHTPNSGGAKGSSYLSTGSETWFSSHEPDDSNDENVKKRSTKGLDSPLTSSNTNSGPYRSSSLSIIKESRFPLSTMQMERSPGTTETLEADETHKYGNDSKNGDLKRRKLGHKDQASKNNFDEWEEAYTFEAKQRKNDETFMKEALLEAKKAADVWEVPVGAVLVKGGKIIARGYNLILLFM
uniref:tRNA(adenine(34)) deaminase, chloroplastic-like isoform X2 n=1 Tax=Erigeron canadensis TaxID=72917 RepID=UPI001CB8C4B0|nr:tRNA(adenine(34)) deaminase, chloroplastic-like isoform X2 [Erigeron canadensis]